MSSIEDQKISDINRKKQQLNSSINDLKGNYEQLQQQESQVRKNRIVKRNETPFGFKLSP